MATGRSTTDIPDVVRAKAFQLVDDDGDVQAELKMSENGSPEFILYFQTGYIRLFAYVEYPHPNLDLPAEPAIGIYDESGFPKLVAQVSGHEPNLTLHSPYDGPGISAHVDGRGRPSVNLSYHSESYIRTYMDYESPHLELRSDRYDHTTVKNGEIVTKVVKADEIIAKTNESDS